MKKIILGAVILLLVILIFIITYKAKVRKNTEVTLPNETTEFNGQKMFEGANWGLKSLLCTKEGFDIFKYAGEKITIKRALAFGKFYKFFPLDIITLYKDNKIICEYYSDSTGRMIPGIFAINDENIFSLW